MSATASKTSALAAAFLVGLGGAYLALRPRPVQVDLASVARGPMDVAIEEEAKTRVRHVYTVFAPIAGRVLRISDPGLSHLHSLHVGDQVEANRTVVAMMQPVAPSFLDARTREELQAAASGAAAAVQLAEAEVKRVEATLEFARSELQRAQGLKEGETISVKALEKAKLDVATNQAALASMKAQLEMRKSERELVNARLLSPVGLPETANNSQCCVEIKAPVNGEVLRIIQESEAPVAAGTPLIQIGDPADLEIAAEFLSTDAIRLKPGAPVRVGGWGGDTLSGRVTRVEPAGFLKVSALGLEEQRVRVIIDFTDPPEAWSGLGHEFRVLVSAVAWSSEGDVLKIPVTALFRKGEDWAVFRKDGNAARLVLVKIGQRNGREAEVLSGLAEGEQVIVHPSDRIKDGVRVQRREGAAQ
jgi:HlyD family secretion protein